MPTETTNNIAQVARWLGVSRQAVHKLLKNRERTGMPLPPWDQESVTKWYVAYEPHRGPRAGVKKKVDTAA